VTDSKFTLTELQVVAASEAWRGNGEILASGIGIVPRLAASLAKLTHTPELMMTDSEALLVEEPVPLGSRGQSPKYTGYMPFDRVFECLWSGRRHVMISPIQIDCYGQTNLSCIGDYAKPKAMMLGARGLPGNSINHMNSMFVPSHSRKVFVSGEVDLVCGVGYNPERWLQGVNRRFGNLCVIVTDLCVMDFLGPDHGIRVKFLHPGVTFDQVQAATGFSLYKAGEASVTPVPTAEQMEIIRYLDPHNLRATVLPGNPAGVRAPSEGNT
jgi:glutaconate CoA-transferase subunit B